MENPKVILHEPSERQATPDDNQTMD